METKSLSVPRQRPRLQCTFNQDEPTLCVGCDGDVQVNGGPVRLAGVANSRFQNALGLAARLAGYPSADTGGIAVVDYPFPTSFPNALKHFAGIRRARNILSAVFRDQLSPLGPHSHARGA